MNFSSLLDCFDNRLILFDCRYTNWGVFGSAMTFRRRITRAAISKNGNNSINRSPIITNKAFIIIGRAFFTTLQSESAEIQKILLATPMASVRIARSEQ